MPLGDRSGKLLKSVSDWVRNKWAGCFASESGLRGWAVLARGLLVLALLVLMLVLTVARDPTFTPIYEAIDKLRASGADTAALTAGMEWLSHLWTVATVVTACLLLVSSVGSWSPAKSARWLGRSRLASQWALALLFLFTFSSANLDVAEDFQPLTRIAGWALMVLAVVPSVGIFQLVSLRMSDEGKLRASSTVD